MGATGAVATRAGVEILAADERPFPALLPKLFYVEQFSWLLAVSRRATGFADRELQAGSWCKLALDIVPGFELSNRAVACPRLERQEFSSKPVGQLHLLFSEEKLCKTSWNFGNGLILMELAGSVGCGKMWCRIFVAGSHALSVWKLTFVVAPNNVLRRTIIGSEHSAGQVLDSCKTRSKAS